MIAARSPIVRLCIQAATPFAVIVGIYLLFAGHNQPGGGFAAGLVLGAVLALRTIVGIDEPAYGLGLLAVGSLLVTIVALVPVLAGGALLDQWTASYEVPLLGPVKTGTALPFDVGVAAVVIGVISTVLDGLGAPSLARNGDRT